MIRDDARPDHALPDDATRRAPYDPPRLVALIGAEAAEGDSGPAADGIDSTPSAFAAS
jgi:hypothetical protein